MAEPAYNPQKLAVLVVDDHELIRKSIIRVLVKMRFETFYECSNAEEALRIIAAQPLDLVLCDLYLNNGSGFDVIQAIRNSDTRSDIPFIVVTGEAGKDDIVKAADLGVEDYILKPFQANDLEKKVNQVLQKYHSPTPLVANIRMAEKYLLDKDFKEAQKFIENALKLDKNSARAVHVSALVYEQTNQVEKATKILKESIKNNPSYLKNYRALANIFTRMGNLPEAARAMKNELELNPKQPDRQVTLAKILHKTGNLLAAAEHYRQALLEDGKMKLALYGMGKVQAEMDNLEKSIYYFKRLRRHHPGNTRALEAIVQYCLAANQPRMAEHALRDEKKQFPKRTDTHVILAKLYAATDRLDDALNVIQEALAIDPQFVDAWKIRGALLHRKGDLNESLDSYKKAIEIKPEVETYIKVAEVLLDKNAFTEATIVLHTALRSGQNTGQILTVLNYITFKSQQAGKAYFLSQRLIKAGAANAQAAEINKRCHHALLLRRQKSQNLAS